MSRPSHGRRAALRNLEGDMQVQVSNFFPLERYYDASDKVLQSFENAYNEKRLDDAYVLGKRYARFSLEALPQHDYYRSSKYVGRRKQNEYNVQRVLAKLEQVAQWMDVEEEEREKLRQERRKRVQEERVRQQEAIERAQYQELQQRIAQQQKKSARTFSEETVKESALSKLQMLGSATYSSRRMNGSNAPLRPDGQRLSSHLSDMDIGDGPSDEGSQSGHDRPSSQRSTSSRRSRWQQNEVSGSQLSEASLPPPLPPPIPPPSYDQVVSKNPLRPVQHTVVVPAGGAVVRSKSDLISLPSSEELSEPLLPPPPYSFYDRDTKRFQPPKITPARVPIRKLQEIYNNEFSRLKQIRKIEVFALNTYQGRLRNSTNGCTVISPLVVSHHLKNPGSVTDSAIVNVIDKECPPLLRDIRNKLELEGDALIIPSDVHDYLVDRKILIQDKFAGACGGNILDDKHTGEFLKILENGESGDHSERKTGAALFFHEHVVSIVKCPVGRGKFCFDLVDSLPRLVDPNDSNKRMASRTRCHDLDAFAALLKWYACGKFSPSNCTYIDRNDWDECMADFDPRVFQAFVWTE